MWKTGVVGLLRYPVITTHTDGSGKASPGLTDIVNKQSRRCIYAYIKLKLTIVDVQAMCLLSEWADHFFQTPHTIMGSADCYMTTFLGLVPTFLHCITSYRCPLQLVLRIACSRSYHKVLSPPSTKLIMNLSMCIWFEMRLYEMMLHSWAAIHISSLTVSFSAFLI